LGKKLLADACIVPGSKIEPMTTLLFDVFSISTAFREALDSSLGLMSGRGFKGYSDIKLGTF
jgi:hypothetical protein